MTRFQKLWLAIILIVIAIIAVLFWAKRATETEFDTLHNVLLQFTFMMIGSVGSFLVGQLVSERQFKLQARERYRRLRTLLKSISEIRRLLWQLEEIPLLTGERRAQGDLEDYKRASNYVFSQSSLWMNNIKDCLEFWNDLAPEQVGQMHEEVLREEKEE